jgi:hypothetical protein
MRFPDRRFLFPVIAATAWAQQPSPAAAEAEGALRARAEQFFKLQVEKKYRQAESMVAEDTKDDYYNGNKFNIKDFSIDRIELLDDNTRAKVTIKARVTMTVPGAGMIDLDAPSLTLWKLEDKEWVWYSDHAKAVETPFGTVKPQEGPNKSDGPPPTLAMAGKAPDIATLQSLVKIDQTSVVLTAEAPEQTVTVSNDLPGGADIELGINQATGFTVDVDKKHLASGEKTLIHFRSANDSHEGGVVQVYVAPLATQFDIQVTKK